MFDFFSLPLCPPPFQPNAPLRINTGSALDWDPFVSERFHHGAYVRQEIMFAEDAIEMRCFICCNTLAVPCLQQSWVVISFRLEVNEKTYQLHSGEVKGGSSQTSYHKEDPEAHWIPSNWQLGWGCKRRCFSIPHPSPVQVSEIPMKWNLSWLLWHWKILKNYHKYNFPSTIIARLRSAHNQATKDTYFFVLHCSELKISMETTQNSVLLAYYWGHNVGDIEIEEIGKV